MGSEETFFDYDEQDDLAMTAFDTSLIGATSDHISSLQRHQYSTSRSIDNLDQGIQMTKPAMENIFEMPGGIEPELGHLSSQEPDQSSSQPRHFKAQQFTQQTDEAHYGDIYARQYLPAPELVSTHIPEDIVSNELQVPCQAKDFDVNSEHIEEGIGSGRIGATQEFDELAFTHQCDFTQDEIDSAMPEAPTFITENDLARRRPTLQRINITEPQQMAEVSMLDDAALEAAVTRGDFAETGVPGDRPTRQASCFPCRDSKRKCTYSNQTRRHRDPRAAQLCDRCWNSRTWEADKASLNIMKMCVPGWSQEYEDYKRRPRRGKPIEFGESGWYARSKAKQIRKEIAKQQAKSPAATDKASINPKTPRSDSPAHSSLQTGIIPDSAPILPATRKPQSANTKRGRQPLQENSTIVSAIEPVTQPWHGSGTLHENTSMTYKNPVLNNRVPSGPNLPHPYMAMQMTPTHQTTFGTTTRQQIPLPTSFPAVPPQLRSRFGTTMSQQRPLPMTFQPNLLPQGQHVQARLQYDRQPNAIPSYLTQGRQAAGSGDGFGSPISPVDAYMAGFQAGMQQNTTAPSYYRIQTQPGLQAQAGMQRRTTVPSHYDVQRQPELQANRWQTIFPPVPPEYILRSQRDR